MGQQTYNAGRVVGYSAYDSFIKEYSIDPETFSEQDFVTILTLGITSQIVLSSSAWDAHLPDLKFFRQTVACPGAVYGVVPTFGIDYTNFSSSDTAANKMEVERKAKCVYTCFVSDSNGNPITNQSQSNYSDPTEGYLTFLAYPEVINQSVDIPVLVRGLGIGALQANTWYKGPFGLDSNLRSSAGSLTASSYSRDYPYETGEVPSYLKLDSAPIIDMESSNPITFYAAHPELSNLLVQVKPDAQNTYSETDILSVLALYQVNSDLPPALYGYRLDTSANNFGAAVSTYPIDIVSPYTVKIRDRMADSEIRNFQDQFPGVRFLSRDPDTSILYTVPEGLEVSKLIPISDDRTENLGGICRTRHKEAYFSSGYANASSDAALSEIKTFCYLATVEGTLSQEFIDEYVIPFSVVDDPNFRNAFQTGTNYDYFDNIKEQVDPSKRGEYGAYLSSEFYGKVSGTPEDKIRCSFKPVHIPTKKLIYSKVESASIWSSNEITFFDFSESARSAALALGKLDRWLLLGSVFNGSRTDHEHQGIWDGLVDVQTTTDQIKYINSHPAYRSVYPDNYADSTSPDRALPCTPYQELEQQPADWATKYRNYYKKEGNVYTKVTGNSAPDWAPNTYYQNDFNWVSWFDSVRLIDFFTEEELGYWNNVEYVLLSSEPEDWATDYEDYYILSGGDYIPVSGSSAPIWEANTYYKKTVQTHFGINPYYWNLSISDVLELAGNNRLYYKPSEYDSPHQVDTNVYEYYFKNSDVVNIGNSGSWGSNDFLISPVRGFCRQNTVDYDWWSPNYYTFEGITIDENDREHITSTGEYFIYGDTVWASIGQSGTNQTTALSLIDGRGNLLPRDGSSGTMVADKLIWSNLIYALANNQSIDLLGDYLLYLKENQNQYSLHLTAPTPEPGKAKYVDWVQLDIQLTKTRRTLNPGNQLKVQAATLTILGSSSDLQPASISGTKFYQVLELTDATSKSNCDSLLQSLYGVLEPVAHNLRIEGTILNSGFAITSDGSTMVGGVSKPASFVLLIYGNRALDDYKGILYVDCTDYNQDKLNSCVLPVGVYLAADSLGITYPTDSTPTSGTWDLPESE